MAERTIRPEVQGASIAVLGSFNPAIFQPLWFSGNNLIRKEEAEAASIQIVNNDVAIFSSVWFSLQAVRDKYVIDTNDPTMYQPLRDLALGTFKILEHTPVRSFGFNRYQHFLFPSEEEWHEFGHHFVPKESWKPILENPGMRTLAVEGTRKGSSATRMQIRIEPSRVVQPGVFIQMNQHYDIPEKSTPMEAIGQLLETLQSSWDEFVSYLESVSEHLLTVYKKAL